MGETYALIPAAGRGERFHPKDTGGGGAVPPAHSPLQSKVFAQLAGRPVLAHTLLAFERCDEIDGIVLVGGPADHPRFRALAEEAGIRKPLLLAEGGASRQESVYRGLLALPSSAEIVAIHDAARPLVTPEVISRTVHAARSHGAALAVIPVVDTIKRVDKEGRSVETYPRESLRAAQTPQTFRVSLIMEAHERARAEGVEVTDDASLAEWRGHSVLCVEGDRHNLKITTPDDLLIAESLLAPQQETAITFPRIGFGYDIHRLAEGRRLVLGGVEIPHSAGLDGHSDADVLIHALMDALLGAAGMPDIGHLFPNTDERWRGASSRAMLREVCERLREAGYRPVNVDMTLIAERPKIAPHLTAMRAAISEDTGLPEDCIGIKATTNEKLGAIGREEGMAAQAVAMIVRDR